MLVQELKTILHLYLVNLLKNNTMFLECMHIYFIL